MTASPTMKVAAEAKRLKAEGFDVIDLSVGEPDFPTPDNIKSAAKKAIENNETRYTINCGTVDLRKSIAKKLKADNNLDYSLNEIIVSNGAKQSIFNAIHTVVDNGDEVILPAPYWVSYPEMIKLAGGKTVYIETDETTGFKISPDQLKNSLTERTKLIILCNPSNPTGSAYTKNELLSLAEIISGKNLFVLSDEIYEMLVYDDYKFVSFASLSNEMKEKTILINGVSKSHSMTGWRIGYTAASENIIKGIDKIQSHSTSNASSISQAAAVEAIQGPQNEVANMKFEFEKRRNFLFDELSSVEGIKCYKPEGAFYLFPNIKAYLGKSFNGKKIDNSIDFSMYLLTEANVAAVPGSAFGSEGYIRFSYATSMDNLKEAARRIKEALHKLKS